MILEVPYKEKISYPISLSEAKRHLNISEADDNDNDYINDCLMSAVEDIEGYIGKDIAYTEVTQTIRDFSGDVIILDIGNLNKVLRIENLHDPSTIYDVDYYEKYRNSVYVYLKDNVSADISIIYSTGYDNTYKIPNRMKRAILIRLGDFYDVERQSYNMSSYKYTNAAYRIVNSYKLTKF